MSWLKENLVSIVSIFISAGTALILGIIVYFQNKKMAKLNGQIERKNYIHKVQFEKEFEIYNKVWEEVHNFSVLRAEMDTILKNIHHEISLEESTKLFKELTDIQHRILDLVSKYGLFYPKEIKINILYFIMEMKKLISIFKSNYIYKKYNKASYKYIYFKLTQIDINLENSIRERIETLKIIN